MKYTDEAVNNVLVLLNNLEVKGIENCTRVAMISQILNSPEKEEKDNGND